VTLLAQVVELLRRADVPFALIGAGALAAHGVARSTLDIDLFTTDSRCIDATFWDPLRRTAALDVRRGDASDPLAGVARFSAPSERSVDLVVGRHTWQTAIPGRARGAIVLDIEIPVASAPDLVLLKLYAGGSHDTWDVEQLLRTASAADRAQIIDEVETGLSPLPPACTGIWREIVLRVSLRPE